MRLVIFALIPLLLFYTRLSYAEPPTQIVMQLTRAAENYGHRRALLQVDRVLRDIGSERLNIVVVAYEEGIHALRADNHQTSQLVTKLANAGVEFRACKISMKAWELTEEQFPMEVEFVPAGASKLIQLQMQGYKYWRP